MIKKQIIILGIKDNAKEALFGDPQGNVTTWCINSLNEKKNIKTNKIKVATIKYLFHS